MEIISVDTNSCSFPLLARKVSPKVVEILLNYQEFFAAKNERFPEFIIGILLRWKITSISNFRGLLQVIQLTLSQM